MILALFWEKLNSIQKPLLVFFFNTRQNARIRKFVFRKFKDISFATELAQAVSIRIGDQSVFIKRGNLPVHLGI